MSTKEQSVTLLRLNKRAQAAAFNVIGMTDVDENTRASEFGRRIRWAGGLLDICVACRRLSDKSEWFFTREEWDAMSATDQQKYIKTGLRVRAYGHSFILAASDAAAGTVAWGNRGAVTDLSYRKCGTMMNDFAGKENTALIIADAPSEAGTNGIIGAPAAEAAAAYKAYSEEYDGIEDTSDWHLPGMGVMLIIERCRPQIQEALEHFWSADSRMIQGSYWSSTHYSAEYAFYFSTSNGVYSVSYKDNLCRVRAVCDEQ